MHDDLPNSNEPFLPAMLTDALLVKVCNAKLLPNIRCQEHAYRADAMLGQRSSHQLQCYRLMYALIHMDHWSLKICLMYRLSSSLDRVPSLLESKSWKTPRASAWEGGGTPISTQRAEMKSCSSLESMLPLRSWSTCVKTLCVSCSKLEYDRLRGGSWSCPENTCLRKLDSSSLLRRWSRSLSSSFSTSRASLLSGAGAPIFAHSSTMKA
mmetsp:Transcript_16118/g.34880  ORF Transcript_16118/g.34880 Transcript_16118/m.34880 type:complete len:210 (-) Transcript_16118:377-1006(-)